MKVKPGDWNGTIIRLEPYTWDQNATCRTGTLHAGLEHYMQDWNTTCRTGTLHAEPEPYTQNQNHARRLEQYKQTGTGRKQTMQTN